MAAHQAPPSLGFFRQEHWSGLPFLSPRAILTKANPSNNWQVIKTSRTTVIINMSQIIFMHLWRVLFVEIQPGIYFSPFSFTICSSKCLYFMLIPACVHLEWVITILTESAGYLLKSLFESLPVSVAYQRDFSIHSRQTMVSFTSGKAFLLGSSCA